MKLMESTFFERSGGKRKCAFDDEKSYSIVSI